MRESPSASGNSPRSRMLDDVYSTTPANPGHKQAPNSPPKEQSKSTTETQSSELNVQQLLAKNKYGHTLQKRKPKKSDYFDPRYRRDRSVERDAALHMLSQLEDPRCLDDMLKTDPNRVFRVSSQMFHNWYHSLACFEGGAWRRGGPAEVFDLDLLPVPVIRGDPNPPPLSNPYIAPGPVGTDLQIKFCPCLLINNEDKDLLFYKVLSTRHGTDLTKLRNSGELDECVQMRRTPQEDGNYPEPCYTS